MLGQESAPEPQPILTAALAGRTGEMSATRRTSTTPVLPCE